MADWHSKTDEALMLELAAGDMAPLGELVRRHQDKALALAYRTLRNNDLAEDIAQDAFIRVYKAAASYRPEAKFTTWFYRIVVNLCLDAMRRSAKNPVNVEEFPEKSSGRKQDDPAYPLEAQEISQVIENAMDKLNERQRAVLVLHRFEGLSHTRIAEITGWSESAIESLLVRAYQKLRTLLKDYRINLK